MFEIPATVDARDADLGLGAMAAAANLADIRIAAELEIESGMLEIDLITMLTVDLTRQRLEIIRNITKQYSKGMVRAAKYFPYLEEKFVLQFEADEKSVLKAVREYEDYILDKLNDVLEYFRMEVEIDLSVLPESRVRPSTVGMIQQRIQQTSYKTTQCVLDMTNMAQKVPHLDWSLKLKSATDLQKIVKEHEDILLSKIDDISNSTKPFSPAQHLTGQAVHPSPALAGLQGDDISLNLAIQVSNPPPLLACVEGDKSPKHQSVQLSHTLPVPGLEQCGVSIQHLSESQNIPDLQPEPGDTVEGGEVSLQHLSGPQDVTDLPPEPAERGVMTLKQLPKSKNAVVIPPEPGEGGSESESSDQQGAGQGSEVFQYLTGSVPYLPPEPGDPQAGESLLHLPKHVTLPQPDLPLHSACRFQDQLYPGDVGCLAYLSLGGTQFGAGYFAFTIDHEIQDHSGIFAAKVSNAEQVTASFHVLDNMGIFLLVYMEVLSAHMMKQLSVCLPVLDAVGVFLLVYNRVVLMS